MRSASCPHRLSPSKLLASSFRTRLPELRPGPGLYAPGLRCRPWGASRPRASHLAGSPFMHCPACGARQPLRPRGLRSPGGCSPRLGAARPFARSRELYGPCWLRSPSKRQLSVKGVALAATSGFLGRSQVSPSCCSRRQRRALGAPPIRRANMRLKPHHPHAHALYLVIRSAPERGCLIESSTVPWTQKSPGMNPGQKRKRL